ncbi:hypothetical protein GCM10020331_022380 [Ectobacillus funiculus]
MTRTIDKGAGVVYVYGNYAGDVMNFGMAADLADLEYGTKVGMVLVTDDVASAPKEEIEKAQRYCG